MNRRGSQSIEFALLLPVLMFITSGLIDYGWYFYYQNHFSQIIKDSARTAITLDHQVSDINPCQFFSEQTNNKLDLSGFPSHGRIISAEIVQDGEARLLVEVSQEYKPLFGLAFVPEKSFAKNVFRLEDQEWNYCQ